MKPPGCINTRRRQVLAVSDSRHDVTLRCSGDKKSDLAAACERGKCEAYTRLRPSVGDRSNPMRLLVQDGGAREERGRVAIFTHTEQRYRKQRTAEGRLQ